MFDRLFQRFSGFAPAPSDRRQSVVARPAFPPRVLGVVALACWILIGVVHQSARADEYLLGPEDTVKLRVYEWRASRDTVFEWKALNDTFVVAPDGMLSLPLAGLVKAENRTTSEVARSIGQQLKAKLGLGAQPDISVSVVQFRPFYITGQVNHPGEFPYRPGLNVLQAVSIAGGLPIAQRDLGRFARESIQGRGDISILRMNDINLLAKKARLQAELAGAETIDFPDQLSSRSSDPVVATAIQQEELVFKARKEGMKTQVRALMELQDFLDNETGTLKEQLALLDKQIASLQTELGSVSKLVTKGLAAAPRQFNLERQVAQAQSDRLAAETSLLRAKQEISRTKLSIIELQDGRKNEITRDLRDTQTALEENMGRETTARQLLYDSEVTAPQLLASRNASMDAKPVYVIFRRTAQGKSITIDADETTPVQPGDTVKVIIPLPAGLDTLQTAPASRPATGNSSSLHPSADATAHGGLAMK